MSKGRIYKIGYNVLINALQNENILEALPTSLDIIRTYTMADNIFIYKKDDKNNYNDIMPTDDNTKSMDVVRIIDHSKNIIEKRNYVVLNDPESSNSLLFVPIQTNDNRYIMTIENADSKLLGPLVNVLKETIGVILQRLDLYIKLDNSSNKDILTGLDNRNSYSKRTQEIDKTDEQYTLALFDLFRLKYINDNYNHSTGDRYIVEVARLLDKYFPKYYYLSDKEGYLKKHKTSSCVYRIGGDEFALITNEDNKEIVELKTKLVREEAKALNLGIEDNTILGINYGIVTRGSNEKFEDLFQIADEALKEDKNKMYKKLGIERRK